MIARHVRVVMVNRFASVAGGAEKHAVGLAALLRDRGHEVAFLSTAAMENVERSGAFVPLPGADFWRGAPPLRERAAMAATALWNRRAAAAMEALVERFRPEVAHFHDIYPQLSVAPVVVAARTAVPIVQTLHNYELISASPVDDTGGWLDRGGDAPSVRSLRTALKAVRLALHVPRVDRWVAVSRFVARAYAGHGIRADALPNFTALPSNGGRPFEERSGIVFAGRLTREKGVLDVISLARRLGSTPVTVIGRGPLERDVREAERELANLSYPGEVAGPEVTGRLAVARLAVIPSRWQEPAGLVALEAMAAGTPVVAYARGGLAEYVRDAGAGPVVAPDDAELAVVCRNLHGDRAAWTRFAVSGRRSVTENHSPERYAERLERVYRAAREERRRGY